MAVLILAYGDSGDMAMTVGFDGKFWNIKDWQQSIVQYDRVQTLYLKKYYLRQFERKC